jgi:hypothetical protein
LRIISKRSVDSNKGIFLNYAGFAVAKKDATLTQPDHFRSPGAPYEYSDYGYIITVTTDQPTVTRHAPPQPSAKPTVPKQPFQVLALIIYLLILATFAFSAYAEIRVRLLGI